MGDPLRVHNLILTCEAPYLSISDDISEIHGNVKLRAQFGIKRHKITGRISCDDGMDYNTLCFAISRFYELSRIRTGRAIGEVIVKTFEANRDFQGIRIDGSIGCLTRKGLFDVIERIYQKSENVVRLEEKVSVPMNVLQFESLIKGGITGYNVTQGLFMMMQKIESLTEAWKFSNRMLMDILKRIDDK